MSAEDFINNSEVYSILSRYNPWWNSQNISIPSVKRSVFQEIKKWILNPPTERAIVISGARQVGKTTLIQQIIYDLINKDGINPDSILYVTFDHPILKIIGADKIIERWKEIKNHTDSEIEYIFFDEIQYTEHWQTWLKHQVDFNKNRRIVVTGSAIPIDAAGTESGVGRWHTITLPTLSFYEFLQIKKVSIPDISNIALFEGLFKLSSHDASRLIEISKILVPYFNEYLLKGGFPKIGQIESIELAQQLLREDIIDKVLKRDMTSIFGVRHVFELEKLFLYLCMHDGGIAEVTSIASILGLAKQTVLNFIGILECSHLLYKLRPFGNGKEVLKGRSKLYLADPAISGSVLLNGKSLLQDRVKLGAAVESAFFKHIFSGISKVTSDFYYWQGKSQHEVDIICRIGESLNAFEVKYSSKYVSKDSLKGLFECIDRFGLEGAYLITGNAQDFGIMETNSKVKIFRVPVFLACYLLGITQR